MLWFGSRWYDPALGRFNQPDVIIPEPDNSLAYDRYQFVYSNPIRYTDPSGHYACGDGYEDSCILEKEEAIRKIATAGYRPDPNCTANALCSDSYATFIQIVVGMGRVPTMDEILMMTAGTEYYDYAGNRSVRSVGKEGLARNYYNACGMDGCQGSELYNFVSGFQPWYGKPYVKGDGSAAARAGHLMSKGLNHKLEADLSNDTAQILDIKDATKLGWTSGKMPNEPWQWFTFTIGPDKRPNFGYEPDKDAFLSVDLANGQVFWMFTGAQDKKFNPEDWR
jgi:hypothetical protein